MAKQPIWTIGTPTTEGYSAPKKGSQARQQYDALKQAEAAITAPTAIATALQEYESLPAKPLSNQEVKRLERLVSNDFQQARDDLEQMATVYREQQVAAIDARFGYSEEKAKEIQKRVKAFLATLTAQAEQFITDLEAEGFEPKNSGYQQEPLDALKKTFEPSGRSRAISILDQEIYAARNTAYNDLNRAHREAERKVVLSGITTPAALTMLDSIPKAADLLANLAANTQAALAAAPTDDDDEEL